MTKKRLTRYERRSVAVVAVCDLRSVDKFLAGKPLAEMTAIRIRDALRALGLEAVEAEHGRYVVE